MSQLIFLLFLVVTTGCEHLIVYEEDSSGLATGKVAARTLLGLSTIGLSELGFTQLKNKLELQAYPITSGSHTLSAPRPTNPIKFIVLGSPMSAVAEVQQMLTRGGNIVVERQEIAQIQEEQRFRLRHASDTDADLLQIGKLSGADRVVFVEGTVRPARFGISLIPHYALSVTVRSVHAESGQIGWHGFASYSTPISDPDSAMGSLTFWAVARALCKQEEGARWIEPGPYRKLVGCVKQISH
jgi:hypothetical protein